MPRKLEDIVTDVYRLVAELDAGLSDGSADYPFAFEALGDNLVIAVGIGTEGILSADDLLRLSAVAEDGEAA